MSDPLRASTYASNVLSMQYGVVTGGNFTAHYGRQHVHHGPREGLQLLKQKVSSAAFHNSSARFDPPKCHENTRLAVLQQIINWIINCNPETKDKLIMWLNGAAGAGKSAILQTLAELCDEQEFLLGSFFFGRLDPTRNHAGYLIPTIAYQIFTYIPTVQEEILAAIENDPLIFDRNILTQLNTLIRQPLQGLIQAGYFTNPTARRVIIIDGLDECLGGDSQREVIDALFHASNKLSLPFLFLVASRPEVAITTLFVSDSSSVLGRIPLQNDHGSHHDIQLYLQDEFRRIRETHPLNRFLQKKWPDHWTIHKLVSKSSGQFIYAATIIKYIKYPRKRPDHSLEIIQGLRPRANDMDMPFAELDGLYTHILQSSEDTSLVLDILRFAINVYSFRGNLYLSDFEYLLDLGPGSIETLMCDLGGLVEIVDMKKGRVIKILHASFQDFLADAARSKLYYRNPDEILAEQLKRCFRVMSKHICAASNNASELEVAARIFLYLASKGDCDIELANMLEGRSIVQLMRLTTLSDDTYKFIVAVFIPGLVHFLKRSGMIDAYVKLQMALDEEYRTMIEPYYRYPKLSFILAIVCHTGRITSDGLTEHVCATQRHADALSLCSNFRNLVDRIIPQNELISGYLRSPERSKKYCLQKSGGRLHSNAILQCLAFLCSSELPSYFHPIGNKTAEAFRSYDAKDVEILSKWVEFEPQNIHEGCLKGDRETTINPRHYLEVLQTCYEDVVSAADDSALTDVWQHCDWLRNIIKKNAASNTKRPPKYEYLVLLGYILYFFPRAGRCENLLHLCETKALLAYTDMFSQHRDALLHAMDAYVKRWSTCGSESLDIDEWAYPYPLAKAKRSIFTLKEKEAVLQLRSQSTM